jgi:hypothetical protein
VSAGETAINPISPTQARHVHGFSRILMLGPLGIETSRAQWMARDNILFPEFWNCEFVGELLDEINWLVHYLCSCCPIIA